MRSHSASQFLVSSQSRDALVVASSNSFGKDEDSVFVTPLQDSELAVYKTCAQEFHETGVVKSGRGGTDRMKFSVHVTLILAAIVFAASVAAGVTPLTILSLRLTNEIDNLAIKVAGRVTNAVVVQLQELIQPAPQLCNAVHRMFQFGLLSSHLEGGLESAEAQALFTFLYSEFEMSGGKGIPFLYVGTEYAADFMYEQSGDMLILWNRTSPFMLAKTPGGNAADRAAHNDIPDATGWRSIGPGKIDTTNGWLLEYDSFDPRKRPWYTVAKAGGPDYMGWTAPYVFADGVTLGVAATRSLRNSTGQFVGVVGSDITLQGVVDFLNSDSMRLSPNMRHTVIDASGLMIASSVPGVVTVQKSSSGDYVRLSVLDESQPQELRSVVQTLEHNAGIATISTQGSLIELDRKYVYATTLSDEYNLIWIYIMYAPTTDFLGPAEATTSVCIGACLGVLVGTVLVALFAAWNLSARLRLLAVDMQRATSLALDSIDIQQTGSRVHEIQAITVEFCKLVNALRSFQKYLPQAQVGFLLSSNLEANLAAIHQRITVLFLDVANFTAIVESLSDSSVIQFYGDVMTLLTCKVLEAEGTLDKYIGDAIMAFWNMPRLVVRHEQRAVEAALACRDSLLHLHWKGWDVEFRIGINTGDCQVGNFGSRDRLNYTAIGDNVNVASRLEALCKSYHTRILISGTTHAGLEPGLFLTRLVDKVAVKGKDSATVLHEVLCWRQDATEGMLQNCQDYEKAFSSYAAGSYPQAKETWWQAAARGDDTAQMMADRLLHGTPEAGGVWRWHTK